MSKTNFERWFQDATSFAPHAWQVRLGAHESCTNRLVRVPTGLGKTLGVVGAWAYRRLECSDQNWPRRLVLCLPMRVLVEQTRRVVGDFLESIGQDVGVHILMGGVRDEADVPWHLQPERPAVLIGTQDMLLSHALNRGYAAPRGRWPMAYALLHSDALWVMDEVQLMSTGLVTSVQLQAFRDRWPDGRSRTWWMSATLQPSWLVTRDVDDPETREEQMLRVPPDERSGAAFDGDKPLVVKTIPAAEDDKARAWAECLRHCRRQSKAAPAGHDASCPDEHRWLRHVLRLLAGIEEARRASR